MSKRAEHRRATRTLASLPPVASERDPLGETSVVIAYCCPGSNDSQFTSSLTDYLLFDARNYGHTVVRGAIFKNETGPRMAFARNELVRMFLEHERKFEYLLMVDSDMGFVERDVYSLVNTMRTLKAQGEQVGMVGGLCFGGGHSTPMFPTVYVYANPEDQKDFILTRMAFYPRDQLIQVNGTGAAFTLIDRGMLEAMQEKFPEPTPWYAETVKAKSTWNWGEDLVLCLRAEALGYKVFVDTSVKIDHYKRTKLNEDLYVERLSLAEAIDGLIEEEPVGVG